MLVASWVVALLVGMAIGVALGPVIGGDDGDRPDEADRVPPDRGLADAECPRPYAASSPWNTPIAPDPPVAMPQFELEHDPDATLSSDPTQYTYPVYEVTRDTPREQVEVRGLFSDVQDDSRLEIHDGGTVELPIPDGLESAAGTDAQFIIVDWETGDEWGAWQAERDGSGRWSIENGYHYNVRWDGVPPQDPQGRPFISRGAGVPYLTGLVRPCEIERGRIEHALAFAYDYPSDDHVYPATKSDGLGDGPDALPEGTRLQLDPSLTPEALEDMGCTGPCRTIAQALQRYGMYVIDNAGRPKVMLEYEGTADWNGVVDADTVSPLPLTSFRVLEPSANQPRPQDR